MKKYKPLLTEINTNLSEIDKSDLNYLTQQGLMDISDDIYLAFYKGKKVIIIDNDDAIDINKVKGLEVLSLIAEWDVNDLKFGKNKKYKMFWMN